MYWNFKAGKGCRKMAAALLCAGIVCASQPVYAQDENLSEGEVVQNLIDDAENLSVDTTEEDVEKYRKDLENWEIDGETGDEENSSFTGSMIPGMNFNSSSNLSLLFAQIQKNMQSQVKESALDKLKQVSALQAEMKQVADVINRLEEFLVSIPETGALPLPDNLKQKMLELEICKSNLPLLKQDVNREAVKTLISMAQSRQDQLSIMVQQQMVYLQDSLGQYNSYVQESDKVLQSSGSQNSMYTGTILEGKGMLFTGLLAGALAGAAGVLIVQRAGKKKL